MIESANSFSGKYLPSRYKAFAGKMDFLNLIKLNVSSASAVDSSLLLFDESNCLLQYLNSEKEMIPTQNRRFKIKL